MREITREHLVELGVTDVTEDGDVYVNYKLKRPSVITGKHKYGQDRKYLAIALPDKTTKIPVKQHYTVKDGSTHSCPGWVYKLELIPLARLMLAWFNGSIGANEDADHIDSNPMNNKLDNLQAISRKENLAKRKLTHSQITLAYKKVQRMLEKTE